MARYRKVDSRIWNDQKFTSLTDDGQLIFLFLLTHPHQTALGAMRATVPGLASEKGWLPERLSEAFGEALSKGMVRHDEKASCVWLPNFLKYNRPESPNVVRAWGSAFDLIPECRLKLQCIQAAKDFLKAFKQPFREAFAEVFGEVLPKDYALSGSGAGAGTGTGSLPPTPPEPSGGEKGRVSSVGPEGWREIPNCDAQAYEAWIGWRLSEGDRIPDLVRIQDARFLAGKGGAAEQRQFVDELVRLRFRRLHDPARNGSVTSAIGRTPYQPAPTAAQMEAEIAAGIRDASGTVIRP